MKMLPTTCPACNRHIKVKSLLCENCDTQIEGLYELPLVAQLTVNDQRFVTDFVKASGSLKEMARLLKLSYPTVRNRLDEIIERIKSAETTDQTSKEESK